MKRLIPAVIILVFIISICVVAHICVDRACEKTLDDIEVFYNGGITADQLENRWKERKEQMALFVNHGFLDKISVYMGQLTLATDDNSHELNAVYKNIKSVLSLIKAEQKFALHSFY